MSTLESIRAKLTPVLTHLNDRFTDFADWVSDAMGTPANILAWLIAVIGWTVLFGTHPALANTNFLPAWFTSQAYNFPLNLITTVAELFIGFLVAAAANRVQRVLFAVLNQIKDLVSKVVQLITSMQQQQARIEQLEQTLMDHVATTAQQHADLLTENTELTRQVHTLLTSMQQQGKPAYNERNPRTGRFAKRATED